MILLDGRQTANRLNEQLKLRIEDAQHRYGRKPKLDVILVGNHPASLSYIRGKERASKKVGMLYELHHLKEDVTQRELEHLIDQLNADDKVDGMILQLPIPKHLDEVSLIDRISRTKDADGFHVINQGNMYQKRKAIHPATPQGIMMLLDAYDINVKGMNAVVIGRSNIVGFPVARLLMDRNATITVCHSKTKHISEYTKQADIIVAAVGVPKMLKKDMVKPDAIIIDVGINRVEGKLVGDVDFENLKDVVGYMTPVPKGVGPMTICALMDNTFTLYLSHVKKA